MGKSSRTQAPCEQPEAVFQSLSYRKNAVDVSVIVGGKRRTNIPTLQHLLQHVDRGNSRRSTCVSSSRRTVAVSACENIP
jgi:hypothetical protein